ncbi:MAG TPA: histidine phosphatase family protein [Longimicrobiales bacterium]|nr:histidine phosphatase family protein [Longimicrobiales bacterium]
MGWPSPFGSRRLYLVRPAVTDAEVDGRVVGPDAVLHPRGRIAAMQLSQRIRDLGIDAIWSSPVPRAQQTASLLAVDYPVPFGLDYALRDLEPGPWQGLTEEEIALRFPDAFATWSLSPSRLELEGRETLHQLQARVLGTLNRILSRHRSALCVTHLAVIRVACLHALGESLDQFLRVDVGRSTIVELSWHHGAGRVRALD